MKRLLLFFTALFTLTGFICLADNMCGPNGQFDPDNNTCWPIQNGGGATVPNHYGAIAIDLNTGYWASASDYTDEKGPINSVVSACGNQCKVIKVTTGRCVGLAYSKVDKIIGYDEAMSTFGKGFYTRKERSNKKALKKCTKNGGKECKIVVNVCSYEAGA